jgi:hypothetical protein
MGKEFNSVKDSGSRREFDTGSRRDRSTGKGLPVLIPPYPLRRLAKHFENGAEKYGKFNWVLGQPLSEYINSCQRHLWAVIEGLDDEDHEAAVIWNMCCFMETKRRIENGELPKELDDMVYTVEDARKVQDRYRNILKENLEPLTITINSGTIVT